jgi:regulatory protein
VTDERPGGRLNARHRKPTPAERRDQRVTVEDPAEVLDAAARLLEARPRSVAEVRRRLLWLGYGTALVDGTLERLAELGYLDDEAFARAWVESRDRSKPRGEHALRRELGLKGVDRSLVDGVLGDRHDRAAAARDATGDTSDPDVSAAERLLAKKLPSILREPDPRRRLQKAYAALARSGFAPDVCSAVSKRTLAAAAENAGGDDGGDPALDAEP